MMTNVTMAGRVTLPHMLFVRMLDFGAPFTCTYGPRHFEAQLAMTGELVDAGALTELGRERVRARLDANGRALYASVGTWAADCVARARLTLVPAPLDDVSTAVRTPDGMRRMTMREARAHFVEYYARLDWPHLAVRWAGHDAERARHNDDDDDDASTTTTTTTTMSTSEASAAAPASAYARRAPGDDDALDGHSFAALVHSRAELVAAARLVADATSRRAVVWSTVSGRRYKQRAAEMAVHVDAMRRAIRAQAAFISALVAAPTPRLHDDARAYTDALDARVLEIVYEDSLGVRDDAAAPAPESTARGTATPATTTMATTATDAARAIVAGALGAVS
jgi:hypothetical protein